MSEFIESDDWERLKINDQYEIQRKYPYLLRKIKSGEIISEFYNKGGYINISIEGKIIPKHRVIAEQWLQKANENDEVDHINHVRDDNHISNLRWISRSGNNKNRSSTCGINYNFIDELTDEAIVVNDYGNHEFEFLYYDPVYDNFYYFNGKQYRELHINEMKQTGALYVKINDTNDKPVKIMINRFKKLYGFI